MPNLKKVTSNHRVAVQRRNLISLPKEIREKFKITEGDILDIHIEGSKIVIEPYKLVPSSQAYFWTDTVQKDMLDAKEDVKSGRTREFSNIEEFLEGLPND